MGGHLTDLKIWLFARSEDGKNIKNTCIKKAWKIVSHITNCKTFLQFLTLTFIRIDLVREILKYSP
jgi:hypothetical protein